MRYFASLIVFLAFSTVCQAGTILVKTPSGKYFVCEISEDAPGDWIPLEEWSGFDEVIYSNGNKPDKPDVPKDRLAVEVSRLADVADDPATRARLASGWNEVIEDVIDENNRVTMQNVDHHISAMQSDILESLSVGGRAKWVIWSEKVASMADDEKKKGTYSVKTLESIQKGLVGL